MTQPASEARVVLERFFRRVYRERDAGAIAEMRDDGAGSVGLGPGILSNADFEGFVRGLYKSFSALEIAIGRFVQEGDECAMSLVFSGTTQSGRRVQVRGTAFARVEGGRILSSENLWDVASLLAQADDAPGPRATELVSAVALLTRR
jgi:hypothetical protein